MGFKAEIWAWRGGGREKEEKEEEEKIPLKSSILSGPLLKKNEKGLFPL